MKISRRAIDRQEAELFKAYRELERLDGEHGGNAIMDYSIAEPLKLNILEQVDKLEQGR